MVRKTQTPVSAPIVSETENIVIETPKDDVKPKKVSKKTKPVVDTPVISTPIVDTPVVDTPVVDTPVVEDTAEQQTTVVSYTSQFAEIGSLVQQLVSIASQLKPLLKSTDKQIARELKTATKSSRHKKRSTGDRAPSGFAKPTLISDELASFLGKELNSLMSRTEVSKEINVYIRAHSLKDVENGKIIHPDEKLAKLLNVGKEVELTYFNLQHYLKHHFPKPAVPVVPAVALQSVVS
jgi:chromatin remodeling complex protein RSC6